MATPQFIARDPLKCLCCGSDTVEKVSGLCQRETWTESTKGHQTGVGQVIGGPSFVTTSRIGTQSVGSTQLMKALAPPEPPRERKSESMTAAVVCGIVVGLMAMFFIAGRSAHPDGTTWLLAILPPVALPALLALIVRPSYLADKNRLAAEFQASHANWLRWMTTWDRLFYCRKCDSVYDPVTGRHAPSMQMPSLL
jgi:hypothetical protein